MFMKRQTQMINCCGSNRKSKLTFMYIAKASTIKNKALEYEIVQLEYESNWIFSLKNNG